MSGHVVFISYSSKDVTVAKQVLEYLEANGISCWMAPRNITPGQHYASAILDAIKTSKVFFLLFSPYSDASEQCLKEVDRAVNARLPIIPFRIENHNPTEAMEYYLCNTHWLDAFARPTGEYFPQILSTCRRILDGKTPEVVTPSRPQKRIEEMSEGMRAMLKRVEEEAKNDLEEGKRFNSNVRDESDPDKTAPIQNPLMKEKKGLQSIEGGKVDRSYAPKVDSAKKKPELKMVEKGKPAPKVEPVRQKRKIEFKSPEEIGLEKQKQKKKSILPLLFITALFGGGVYHYLTGANKEKKDFKNVSDNIREIQKQQNNANSGKQEEQQDDKINYKYLSTKILPQNKLTFLSDDELEEMKSQIVAKDGDLFVKQGANLVEKPNNRFEINNLAIIDSRFHEKRIQRLKSVQSQNLDLNTKYPVLYFESSKFDDDRQTEASWKLHSNLMLKMVRSHRVLAKTTKYYPDQDEWNPEYLREKGNIVLSSGLVPGKETFVKVKIFDNKRTNYDFENLKKELSTALDGKLDSIDIQVEEQESREVPKVEIEISVGENLKEAVESKTLQEIENILSSNFSNLVK
jgi:hypothetical protein